MIAEPEEIVVGSVNEDFAMESSAGDVFLLGSTSWRIQRVEQSAVRVTDARGAPPTVPFWLGEAPGGRSSSPRKWADCGATSRSDSTAIAVIAAIAKRCANG